MSKANQRVLLIDTCGENAGVALCLGEKVMAVEEFYPGEASAQIVGAVGRLLHEQGWMLSELDAVGVVGGPGYFTGVRTGIAAAKGFCEAGSLELAVVSRLAILASAGEVSEALAVLDAGREEYFVRDEHLGREWLSSAQEILSLGLRGIVVEQAKVAERLAKLEPLFRPLQVADALPLVLQALQNGGSDVALAEANYGRGEQEIYAKPGVRPVGRS